MEIEDRIKQIIEPYNLNGEWKKVQEMLKPYVTEENPDPLFLMHYAIALYYDDSYSQALVYSTRAFNERNRDPFILYHHGIILMLNKQFNDAIGLFKKIISFSDDYLINGKFGGGKKWATSLRNDVIYYIAKTYFYKNDLVQAIKYYKEHLKMRQKGIASFITKKEVVKELEGAEFLMEYERKYPEKSKPII